MEKTSAVIFFPFNNEVKRFTFDYVRHVGPFNGFLVHTSSILCVAEWAKSVPNC